DNDYTGITGPGGVGADNSNLLWLRADLIDGLSDGDNVSTWVDTSGNNNDAVQSFSANQPTYQTNEINGKPSVRFDDGNDYFRSLFEISSQNMTVYTVFNIAAATDGPLWQTNMVNESGFFPRYTDNIQYLNYGAGWLQKASEFNVGTWYIGTALYGTGSTKLYQDGDSIHYFAGNTVTIDSFQIGARLSGNNYYGGDIAEIIFYNYDLNDAERIIVDNYLAAKYDHTITNDKYAYEATHSYDVAGIGREDASNVHTTAMSAKMLKISNASDLSDGDYLLIG
ncbi:unnamed protein product, partial [marine sediment metagenome]